MTQTWCNWSHSVRCTPRRRERPESEARIPALLRDAAAAGLEVRVAGRGHSHAPLVATDGLLLELDALSGVEACDPDLREANVLAGTPLAAIGAPLLAHGLAMENLGDVDVQSLAGAVATGTHGTGQRLRNLSNQVAALRLYTASGERLECSPTDAPHVFEAARVSLGAFGVVAAVRLRLVPAYRLYERIWREDVLPGLAALPERIATHRHCEFFWLPHKDRLEWKTLHPSPLASDALAQRARERAGAAHEILPSLRDVRHVEMEYAVPAEHGVACFLELRECMRRRHPDVVWPVEFRTVAADTIPLSPAYGRETVTLSLHQGEGLAYEALFADGEAIFRNFAGRPHWGKLHARSARELRDLYPRWNEFHAVRRELDPHGRFLNAHLRELFGDAA